MWWFRLASHLHLPLQRVQAETTYSEFLDWIHYLQHEYPNDFNPDHWYYAKIIATIKASNSKEAVSIKDQLISFAPEEVPKEPTTEEERQAWIARSKANWAAALGMSI